MALDKASITIIFVAGAKIKHCAPGSQVLQRYRVVIMIIAVTAKNSWSAPLACIGHPVTASDWVDVAGNCPL